MFPRLVARKDQTKSVPAVHFLGKPVCNSTHSNCKVFDGVLFTPVFEVQVLSGTTVTVDDSHDCRHRVRVIEEVSL